MVPRNSIILEFVHPPEGEKKTHSSSAGPSIVPVCASRPNKYTGIIMKPVPAIFRALPRWSTPLRARHDRPGPLLRLLLLLLLLLPAAAVASVEPDIITSRTKKQTRYAIFWYITYTHADCVCRGHTYRSGQIVYENEPQMSSADSRLYSVSISHEKAGSSCMS